MSCTCRGYAAEAAVAAEAKVQYGRPFDRAVKERKGQITEQVVDEQLMRLDKQVQSWGRIDHEQVQELLSLVKRAG